MAKVLSDPSVAIAKALGLNPPDVHRIVITVEPFGVAVDVRMRATDAVPETLRTYALVETTTFGEGTEPPEDAAS